MARSLLVARAAIYLNVTTRGCRAAYSRHPLIITCALRDSMVRCRDATMGVADWSQRDSNRLELALLQCDGMPSAVHMVSSCRYSWCALQNWSVLTPCG